MTKFAAGDRVVFDTHGADSMLNDLTGTTGTVIRPHQHAPAGTGVWTPEDGYDSDPVHEVGQMYFVKLDGRNEPVSAFEDELSFAPNAIRAANELRHRDALRLFGTTYQQDGAIRDRSLPERDELVSGSPAPWFSYAANSLVHPSLHARNQVAKYSWDLGLAESRGWDRQAHVAALAAGDEDAITLTHPTNWLTEEEVENA